MDGKAPQDGPFPEDDFDLDAYSDWLAREIDEGRQHVPPEWSVEDPDISISLGDSAFGEDKAADRLRPGPVLAARTAQAVSRSASLADDDLISALQDARRLANLADYQQTVAIAEFARRRTAEFEAAKARGVPVGCRDGEFPGEELAMELVETGPYTSARIDTATELTTRLPRTLAGMADGLIDLGRAMTIAARTLVLSDAGAARADEILAAVAPDLRPDQLARKAAALEMKLAPEAVAARKEHAKKTGQRVEARREESGNASLSGRELDTADVMASKAYLDAIAVRLRNSGLIDGNLGRLRALALTDLTQGRNPLDRIRPNPSAETPVPAPASDAQAAAGASGNGPESPTGSPGAAPSGPTASDVGPGYAGPDGWPGWDDDEAANAGYQDDLADELEDSSRRGPTRPGDPVPLPALINLLVPVGTLLGWSTAPALAGNWGLLDADEIRVLLQAASRHPRTRWCITPTAPDGTALAHGCAKGQHPWPPPDPQPPPGGGGPTEAQAAQLADLLRRLNVTLEPVARETCDHKHAEKRYVPSRKLKHLIRARAQLCTAPACNAQAVFSDLDHTIPYPDGPTDECNLNPKCRRHHRTKQAPGWKVTQPTPDTTVWTTPSGRTHTTSPTAYDL